MASYPELSELAWLFEVEPTYAEEDLGWPISEAVFTTTRGDWDVRCSVGVYDYSVEIECALRQEPTIYLKLNQVVDQLAVDRTHGAETLRIRPMASSGLGDVWFQLKPNIQLRAQTVLPWEPRP